MIRTDYTATVFAPFMMKQRKDGIAFFTARDIPNMLAYKAMLVDGGISVLSPDGRTFGWNEHLLEEIQKYSTRKISMAGYKSPNPENPELMAVDLASVLIIPDKSMQKLEAIWGNRLDSHRFRANIVVSLDEEKINEVDWIGKRLVGNTEFQVDSYCERCSIISIYPNTLERDASLLKKVNEEMSLIFGVYASVKKTGQIHVGDQVYLMD
ncbi:MAG: MOSC domain-containing protein [Bacillota bacterium]